MPIKALSFVDNIGLIATGGSIKEIVETLEKVGKEAVQWGLGNNISFEVDKTEVVLFTRQRKLARKIRRTKINLEGKRIKFNSEATRWLGI